MPKSMEIVRESLQNEGPRGHRQPAERLQRAQPAFQEPQIEGNRLGEEPRSRPQSLARRTRPCQPSRRPEVKPSERPKSRKPLGKGAQKPPKKARTDGRTDPPNTKTLLDRGKLTALAITP